MVSSSFFFSPRLSGKGDDLEAGHLHAPGGMSYGAALDVLAKGRQRTS